MRKSYIWIQCQFEGFHHWPDAPDEVRFLRNPHRHIFHVKAKWEVRHNDRDLEFFIQKGLVEKLIGEIKITTNVDTWSCETWATEIMNRTGAIEVEVSEDGENGAIVSDA